MNLSSRIKGVLGRWRQGGAFGPERSLRQRVVALESRVASLERRVLNRRNSAIDEVTDYLVGAEVPGDYLEFGVYVGATFRYACTCLAGAFPRMRFVACDSFAGLPEPRGLDAHQGYTSNFQKGQFACTEEQFVANLRQEGIDLSRVITVKGWFDQSLTPELARRHNLKQVAVAWIDCDLYESTVPVLEFIGPRLSEGSVILFDDWRCFRNLPDYGEQRACREWLGRNPDLSLHELFSFGWHGKAFSVAIRRTGSLSEPPTPNRQMA